MSERDILREFKCHNCGHRTNDDDCEECPNCGNCMVCAGCGLDEGDCECATNTTPDPAPSEGPERPSRLTPEQIEEAMKDGRANADDLHRLRDEGVRRYSAEILGNDVEGTTSVGLDPDDDGEWHRHDDCSAHRDATIAEKDRKIAALEEVIAAEDDKIKASLRARIRQLTAALKIRELTAARDAAKPSEPTELDVLMFDNPIGEQECCGATNMHDPLCARVQEEIERRRAEPSTTPESRHPLPLCGICGCRPHNCDVEPTLTDGTRFQLTVEMRTRWVPHFLAMLTYMQRLGSIGSSRIVSLVADGDGDFRPRFDWDPALPSNGQYLNDEDGHRTFDADAGLIDTPEPTRTPSDTSEPTLRDRVKTGTISDRGAAMLAGLGVDPGHRPSDGGGLMDEFPGDFVDPGEPPSGTWCADPKCSWTLYNKPHWHCFEECQQVMFEGTLLCDRAPKCLGVQPETP
jgi:hypothetical protein